MEGSRFFLWLLLGILAICVGCLLFDQAVVDIGYRIRYGYFHEKAEVLKTVHPEVEGSLDNAVPAGSISGDGICVRHSSWYDSGHRLYYYQVKNCGEKSVCVRSSFLPRLVGRRSFFIHPGGSLFVALSSDSLPARYKDGKFLEKQFDLHITEGCVVSGVRGGTSMYVVVPESMR